jgi:hypothetical protein
MAADELARARLSVAQGTRQRAARRARETSMQGSSAARKALAADYAPVSTKEAYRAATSAPTAPVLPEVPDEPV